MTVVTVVVIGTVVTLLTVEALVTVVTKVSVVIMMKKIYENLLWEKQLCDTQQYQGIKL